MKRRSFIACVASGIFCAQPAIAAEHMNGGRSAFEPRRGGFAGLNLTLPLGGTNGGKAVARLQVTSMRGVSDPHSGAALEGPRPGGLEIGLDGKGKPAFYVGGQSAAQMQEKLGVRGNSGTTLLIVGGVVLLVLLVVAAKETAGFGALPPG